VRRARPGTNMPTQVIALELVVCFVARVVLLSSCAALE
jgi:hypothetical protein